MLNCVELRKYIFSTIIIGVFLRRLFIRKLHFISTGGTGRRRKKETLTIQCDSIISSSGWNTRIRTHKRRDIMASDAKRTRRVMQWKQDVLSVSLLFWMYSVVDVSRCIQHKRQATHSIRVRIQTGNERTSSGNFDCHCAWTRTNNERVNLSGFIYEYIQRCKRQKVSVHSHRKALSALRLR